MPWPAPKPRATAATNTAMAPVWRRLLRLLLTVLCDFEVQKVVLEPANRTVSVS